MEIDLSKFRPLVIDGLIIPKYLINEYGDIYSLHLRCLMKQGTTVDGYKRIDLVVNKRKI